MDNQRGVKMGARRQRSTDYGRSNCSTVNGKAPPIVDWPIAVDQAINGCGELRGLTPAAAYGQSGTPVTTTSWWLHLYNMDLW